ncbi:SUMF1/EgtB/PvdO family nonheme iron enzyme [Leptothoe sp. EHU-05/26/07-4]
MIRIFLAHASEDKEAVTHLYQCLKARGFQPWLDKVDLLPGQNWRAEIPKAIEASDVFLACLSERSIKKQGYIQREFRMALNEMADRPPGQIFLIPVRLDDCQIPDLRQEEYGINLRDYQWLDLFQDGEFERLVKSIELHLKNAAAPLNIPKLPKLQTFTFETVKINDRGSIISREQKSAEYFRQDLGNGVYLDMVKIPGSRFWMGSPDNEIKRMAREGPRHRVNVPDFYMGKYPVTQAQWKAIALLDDIDIELSAAPSDFRGKQRPVERVLWYEAVEFCKRLSKRSTLSYRFPSEAEWEYACRANNSMSFSFGPTLTAGIANYDARDTYDQEAKGKSVHETTDVGSFPPNSFGLYDMHGNVEEFCQDTFHLSYEGAPDDGSSWTSGFSFGRVVRGGSWMSPPKKCRSAAREPVSSSFRFRWVGFRVACSATTGSFP